VAVLLQSMPSGLARLEREGLLRRGAGDLLAIRPIRLPKGARPPSQVVDDGRSD
jgi:hypothetical protein